MSDVLVTLAQAKEHLRIVGTQDDSYVAGLILAAADTIERDTGVVAGTRSIVDAFDSFDALVLRKRPVNSVTSVQYRDGDTGAVTTWGAANYRLEAGFGLPRIVPAINVTLPKLQDTPGAVTVTYSAGHATANTYPPSLRHGALVLISHWYEHREAVAAATVNTVPLAYDALIGAHKLLRHI